ncbi:hypothetical protein BDV40DRAFT_306838 [Aspergillus tamarii]|uniref:Uncharacterized protein n=1 Tax=Aspergillus tamarii TaxID=41984 RepID=A0A5N6UAI8_ASPTM|nr:hypothetical protein BDV40DRAFT_306838 [Aspergillus tamarii]
MASKPNQTHSEISPPYARLTALQQRLEQTLRPASQASPSKPPRRAVRFPEHPQPDSGNTIDKSDLDEADPSGDEDDAEWDIESSAEHQSGTGDAQPENTRPDGVMMIIMSLLKDLEERVHTLETSFDEQIAHSENQAQEANCVTAVTVPQTQRKTGRTRRPAS